MEFAARVREEAFLLKNSKGRTDTVCYNSLDAVNKFRRKCLSQRQL